MRGFPPEIVEEARRLLEETALPLAAVAARSGVSVNTLCCWRKKHGWRRPPEAPTFLPRPRADGRARPVRSRVLKGNPYTADAVGAAEHLLKTTLLSQAAIAERLAVSQGWVGRLLRRRDWKRPAVPTQVGPARFAQLGGPAPGTPGIGGSKRFAAASRTGPVATEGDRRGRPYAPSVRREARILWEETRGSTALIAARVGATAWTIALWARREGWSRPRGRPGRRQLRGFFGALKGRRGAARTPRVRLL